VCVVYVQSPAKGNEDQQRSHVTRVKGEGQVGRCWISAGKTRTVWMSDVRRGETSKRRSVGRDSEESVSVQRHSQQDQFGLEERERERGREKERDREGDCLNGLWLWLLALSLWCLWRGAIASLLLPDKKNADGAGNALFTSAQSPPEVVTRNKMAPFQNLLKFKCILMN
jgi:hypothetical protein